MYQWRGFSEIFMMGHMGRPPKQKLAADFKELLEYVGKNIRAIRMEQGISQTKLAKDSGVSLTTLNEIESKYHRDIRLSTLSSFARILKVSVLEFFQESDLDLSTSDRQRLKKASEDLLILTQKLSKK